MKTQPIGYRESTFSNRQLDNRRLIELIHGRIHVPAFCLASAILGSTCVALAVVILLIRGPVDGQAVGAHLSLLNHYAPGFSVSWLGAAVGAFWGALFAAIAAALLAIAWNVASSATLLWSAIRNRLLGDDFS